MLIHVEHEAFVFCLKVNKKKKKRRIENITYL